MTQTDLRTITLPGSTGELSSLPAFNQLADVDFAGMSTILIDVPYTVTATVTAPAARMTEWMTDYVTRLTTV